MKVAIILNSFPEISEKFLLNHIIGLIESGIDVTVFPAHRAKTEQRHDIFYKYDIEKYTSYLNIPRGFLNRALVAPWLFLKLFIRRPKAAIESLKVWKYKTVVKNLKLLHYANHFVGSSYDIVHCHFGPNGLIGIFLKELGICSKVVVTFHGSDINRYPRVHGENVYGYMYANADLITANTNFTKSKIVANGCPESLIKIIPASLIASEYSDIGDTERIPNTVLTVGRLEEKKGHKYALEAIAIIRRSIPDIQYFIIGGGSLETELKTLAVNLGIWDNCHFMGSCLGSEVKKYYASCSVFTLPSVTATNGDMEGQGLVLQEAQICGMPVVSTIHNGIPDGILDGETGYLVPEKDSSRLAERLQFLLKNPEICSRFAERGKEFVANKYDISVTTDSLVLLYKQLFRDEAKETIQ